MEPGVRRGAPRRGLRRRPRPTGSARNRATCRTTTPTGGSTSRTSGARSPASVRCTGRIRPTRSGPGAPPRAPGGTRRPRAAEPVPGGPPLALTARPSGSYNRGVNGERAVLTYRDYEALPADGRRYELHDGQLSVTPAPGTRHQRVSSALNSILKAYVTSHGLGEVLYAPIDVILADTTVVQPDLVYLEPTCAHLVSDRGIEGPPTLVIEILSPSTTTIDRSRKRRALRGSTGSRTTGSWIPRAGPSRPSASTPAATRSSRAAPAPAPWRCRRSSTSPSRPPRSGPDGPLRLAVALMQSCRRDHRDDSPMTSPRPSGVPTATKPSQSFEPPARS